MIKYLLGIISGIALTFIAFQVLEKLTCEPAVIDVPAEEPEESPFNFKKSSFEDLNGWAKDDLSELIKAFNLSCNQIKKEKKEFLSSSLAHIPTKDYQEICSYFSSENISTSEDFKKFVEDNFTPYLVTFEDSKDGKFTSYYEAAINISKNKTSKYKYPVYGRPYDLIEFNPKDFDQEAESKRYLGRVEGTKLVPYYTREYIDSSKMNAPVLFWTDSLVDLHVMQIQGSAIGTFEDGSSARIGYAENNGHPFKGIGSILLEKKLIQPGQASMGKIKKWLNEKGDEAVKYLNQNKRYVFFRVIDSHPENHGPIGAQGVSLTAGRSIAVDRTFIPLGSLLWLETTGPNREDIKKLVIAQDIGSAIKGAVRGDYFWGSGHDDILELAGKMNSKGHYYIMLPNTMEIK